MSEETLKVLQLIEEGKISAEDGRKLLEAMGRRQQESAPGPHPSAAAVRICCTEDGRGSENVNIRLPLGLARFAVKHIPRHARRAMNDAGFDPDKLVDQILSGCCGQILDVQDKGRRVQVVVESCCDDVGQPDPCKPSGVSEAGDDSAAC